MKRIVQNVFLTLLFCIAAQYSLLAFTAIRSGNWSDATIWQEGISPGQEVLAQDILIPAGINVNLDMSVNFTGVLNSFTVDGSLKGTQNLTMSQGSFTGLGLTDIRSLTFKALATYSYAGELMVDNLANQGASLVLTSLLELNDSLNLNSGSLVLGTGANLILEEGSTLVLESGTMLLNGGIFQSTTYRLVYKGTSKVSGAELGLGRVSDLVLDLQNNAQAINLNSTLQVVNDLDLRTGTLNFSGQSLKLGGAVKQAAGTFLTSSPLSNLELNGTSTQLQSISFSPGSRLGSLAVNRLQNSAVFLASNLSIDGVLNLKSGTLNIGQGANLVLSENTIIRVEDGRIAVTEGSLSLNSTYDVEYLGSNAVTGPELSGASLRNILVDLRDNLSTLTLSRDLNLTGAFEFLKGQIDLNGNDLSFNGTFNQAANARFIGDALSEMTFNLSTATNAALAFTSNSDVLRRLNLTLPENSQLNLGSDLTIMDQLTLGGGLLDINNNNLEIASTGLISGFNRARYILTSGEGNLIMQVNRLAPFQVFPVGTETGFAPASLRQLENADAGRFLVRAMDGFLSDGTFGDNRALFDMVVNHTWMIDAESSVDDINLLMKLGWNAASEVNGFNRANAHITHFTEGQWDGYMAGQAQSIGDNMFEIERTGIRSLSPFGVADAAELLTVGENFVNVSVKPNPATDFIHVAFDDHSAATAEVMDITGKTIIRKDFVGDARIAISDLKEGVYMIKIMPENGKAITKKFVKS